MPKFNPQEDESIQLPNSSYQFSAVKPEHLKATEYTLATIVMDISGSVVDFAEALSKVRNEIIDACNKSPRRENLLIRFITFNTHVTEEHGFKLLSLIDVNDYKDLIPGGGTALFDAAHAALEATNVYAKTLASKFFTVNACVYIITDGEDNFSTFSPSVVKKEIESAIHGEDLESLTTVLVGLNTNLGLSSYLQRFQSEAGIQQYVDVGDATPGKLAKLAGFISKSISSSSQSLGTGTGPATAPTTF